MLVLERSNFKTSRLSWVAGKQFKRSLINMALAVWPVEGSSRLQKSSSLYDVVFVCVLRLKGEKWPQRIYGNETTSCEMERVQSLWVPHWWVTGHQKAQQWREGGREFKDLSIRLTDPRTSLLCRCWSSDVNFAMLCLSFPIFLFFNYRVWVVDKDHASSPQCHL